MRHDVPLSWIEQAEAREVITTATSETPEVPAAPAKPLATASLWFTLTRAWLDRKSRAADEPVAS